MRVVVIGSGLMGLVTAYFLRRSGADVCVVDRQDSPGREASFANGGMLHASQAYPWNSPGILRAAIRMLGKEDAALLIRPTALPRLLGWGYSFVRESAPARFAANIARNARLAQHSLSVMREIRAAEALEYDYCDAGTLTIYRTQEELDTAGRYADRFSSNEIAFDVVDRDRAVALEPALRAVSDQIVGASYFPNDESGDAFKFCQGLYRACERDGVEFMLGTRVKALVRDGAAIVSADTDGRRLRADKFVIAAGSYTPLLARTARLRVPVQPVKGYSLTAPVGAWDGGPAMPVIDEHLHTAVCPLGDRLRVAGTAEFAGYNTALTKSRVENLFRLLTSLYPDYEPHSQPSETDRWAGLRPMAPDGVGIMGRTPISNLFLNTGHGHLGWTMAAGAGKAVASEVLGLEESFDLTDYRLENR